MSELNYASDGVPVKVNRVFDSCSDRDCLSGVQIILDSGELSPDINLVKAKCVKVTDVCINTEPVPFNKGFFAIDMTYTFRVELLAYKKACDSPEILTGTAYAGKSCVLYGSESAVKIFSGGSSGSSSSGGAVDSVCCDTVSLPSVNVSVVEPVVLQTKIEMICSADAQTSAEESSSGCCRNRVRAVVMTLGLFSVVELTRPVTIMVPTYEYTIPRKECCSDTDTPCEAFEKIRFPEEEFSPAALSGNSGCKSCGECCEDNN